MHPILSGRLRLALYLGVWAGIGALLGGLLDAFQPRPLGQLVLFLAPLLVVYAFACLSAWWVCRANPLAGTPPQRLLVVIAGASAQASAMWVLLAGLWAVVLSRVAHVGPDRNGILRDLASLGIAGVVLYVQSMAWHYFLLGIESARESERRVFASHMEAREAELRALRAQLNPHFLFNSLNSISALAGSDPEAARRMCQLLGEFLRSSLALGARERVNFSEELALAERYLAVEQVRFGARLRFEKDIGASVGACLVLPLLIQPLIENAVKHGVADRVEGGTVRIEAHERNGTLTIEVHNPRDPDAPPRRGAGMGLENVRRRLEALDPGARAWMWRANRRRSSSGSRCRLFRAMEGSFMAREAQLIRTVLVDDEAPARQLLREYLASEPGIEVVAECANGFEALKRIGELAPDLVLLDVQMPKLDGFEVLELLEHPPAVVFVTAYDEYALKAFEVHAVDYIMKPVGRERLSEALAQVRSRLSGTAAESPTPSPTALGAAARAPGRFVERLLVKDGANVHVIPVERLDWIEAQDDYAGIRSEGRTYLKPEPLAGLAAALDPDRFVRIHRSYVLNVDRLARLELVAKDSRVAILKDGKELPVSRAGYARLKELL